MVAISKLTPPSAAVSSMATTNSAPVPNATRLESRAARILVSHRPSNFNPKFRASPSNRAASPASAGNPA